MARTTVDMAVKQKYMDVRKLHSGSSQSVYTSAPPTLRTRDQGDAAVAARVRDEQCQ